MGHVDNPGPSLARHKLPTHSWWLSHYFSGGPTSVHFFWAGHWPSSLHVPFKVETTREPAAFAWGPISQAKSLNNPLPLPFQGNSVAFSSAASAWYPCAVGCRAAHGKLGPGRFVAETQRHVVNEHETQKTFLPPAFGIHVNLQGRLFCSLFNMAETMRRYG